MSQKEKIILVWYKRDLRVSDHHPLTEALNRGVQMNIPIVGIYSFEPRVTSAPDFSQFHRQFIEDSLGDLRDSLEKLGVPFIVFERHISDVMKLIQVSYDIESVFSHEETGNGITYERDIMMKRYLNSKNISWTEYPTNGIVRRLRSRDDWSKIWNNRMMVPILPVPEGQDLYIPIVVSDTWQSILEGNKNIQKGGEREGQKTLASFLISRGKRYMGGMSRPIEGQKASSRISPYLAYGCISLKQVVQMTWVRMSDLKEKGDSRFLRGLQAFHSRLHWQSHFIQKLEDQPKLEQQHAVILYDSIRIEYDEVMMSRIEQARTGVPFIDGTIRQLQATGWINFRARATLVSFVCCTCMQPWKGRFAHWLARLFTDYEPGIHYMQLQMQSGTMGINTIRIYNPMKQLHDKDSDGFFVDTYLPELMKLPKHLQGAPWTISEMESIEYDFVLGRDYPHPIIDVESANRSARAILYDMKSQIDPRVKKSIIEKHASRKGVPKKKSVKKEKQNPDSNLSLFD